MSIRVGLSGWSYNDWTGRFYPPGLHSSEWLAFVASIFPTVEVNRTFYSLLQPDTYRQWLKEVPSDFVFSVKGSRYITHMKRLRDVETPLANFFASGVLELGGHLDTLLWQLPANQKVSSSVLADFLSMLPTSSDQAARIARHHDQRVTRFEKPAGATSPIRHAVELRHPESLDSDLLHAARTHNVAIAISHASNWPLFDERTADFAYIRLHGPGKLYASAYSSQELDGWCSRITRMGIEQDVLVYFDNDSGAHAPHDAMALMDRLARG
ncbi:MAG TPA: DUF72 domain-containing protein [Acidimicrobiia bacterium]